MKQLHGAKNLNTQLRSNSYETAEIQILIKKQRVKKEVSKDLMKGQMLRKAKEHISKKFKGKLNY